MSVDRVTYLDSSAIVKLVVREPESAALLRFLRSRRPLVSSSLARTEVLRACLMLGPATHRRAEDVLERLELIRVSDRVLMDAGQLGPPELRSLDAIHLATASMLGTTLRRVVTYDARMISACRALKLPAASPA